MIICSHTCRYVALEIIQIRTPNFDKKSLNELHLTFFDVYHIINNQYLAINTYYVVDQMHPAC